MRAGHAAEPAGHLVLDLGEQPACDYFPRCDDPGPDPVYPLQMWLCSSCGLAQLLADPTVPEEPRGTEPAALVAQAADAVDRVAAAGLLPDGGVVAEYGSPHGGSWLGLLAARGLVPSGPGGQADVIVDCFGMMHAADQRAALAERAARLAPGGVLLLQYHALSTIIGQRPVERAAARALRVLLDDRADRHAGRGRLQPAHGLAVRPLRRHRAAGRDQRRRRGRASRTTVVASRCWPTTPAPASAIPARSPASSGMYGRTLRRCMTGWPRSGPPGPQVLGYGAASRAVALLCQAHVDRTALARGRRRLARQARPADAGYRHPRGQPGRARRTQPGRGAAVRPGPAGRGSRRPTRRWNRPAAGGSTRTTLGSTEACSRTRSRARHRPRVGPMLPIGSPS